MAVGQWRVERFRGPAAELLAAPWADPAELVVRFMEPERPALVLGSTQREEVVDLDHAEAAGVEVVKRASGGGAVLVEPGRLVWVEVMVPSGGPRWDNDVGRAAWWLGEAWGDALGTLGIGKARVHRGGLVTNQWSSLICFAGLGPGEVTVAGRKVVGISQRRTRAAARFQCAALLSWDPAYTTSFLRLGGEDRQAATLALDGSAAGLSTEARDLEAAFAAAVQT